jgi:hypothetical protein
MDGAGFAFRGDHRLPQKTTASIRMQANMHYSMTRRGAHVFGSFGAAGGLGTAGGVGGLIL